MADSRTDEELLAAGRRRFRLPRSRLAPVLALATLVALALGAVVAVTRGID